MSGMSILDYNTGKTNNVNKANKTNILFFRKNFAVFLKKVLTHVFVRVIIYSESEGRNMKLSELLKLFSKNKIILVQHGKRHDIYQSPITGKRFPVPRHAKEISVGTLKSIMKDAGLE